MKKEILEIRLNIEELCSCFTVLKIATDNEFEKVKNIDISNFLEIIISKINQIITDLNDTI